ncbi:hypothetical protein LRD69_14645 [Streptomyces sp. JH14]|uniref:hypothetical protein n=1 Tax=Streptomyces sp. JH14 TaxID=2793630 RepID=UPI0023F97FB0|nr:hypothetical protein [Streptomyces sp. JH14]MDF6043360.1 hypothetical protein [Streptomyces sp. JH14]
MRFSIPRRYTEIPGIEELARAGDEMVPPPMIASAQPLPVPDDSSVNIALPSIRAELVVTPAHLPWTVNA